jgi:uncharacterized protein
MRVVADTNTVVSGLLWHGPPRNLLDAARAGSLTLFTSVDLLAELEEVLSRPKFHQRLALANVSVEDLALGYGALANIVEPIPLEAVVLVDPDDDAVLACALAAHAEAIVSGDHHLLDLAQHQGITILTSAELLSRLAGRSLEK